MAELVQLKEDEDNGACVCKCGDGISVMINADILSDYSGYFSAIIHSQMKETKEKSLDLTLFSSTSVKLLLKMFHLKDVELNSSEVIEIVLGNLDLQVLEGVLKLIDYLDMPCLYQRCTELLIVLIPSFCLNVDKVLQIWQICKTYSLKSVQEIMFKHIAQNISDIEHRDIFFLRKVPGDVLCGVLTNIDVSSQVVIMRCIVNWIQFLQEERIQWFGKLFKCLHIPSLTQSEVSEIDCMVKDLGISDADIWQKFFNYRSNPHKFLMSRPELSEIHNGKEVLMLFGGMSQHEQFTDGRGRRHVHSVPLMFQEISQVRRQCSNMFQDKMSEMNMSRRRLRSRSHLSYDRELSFKTAYKLDFPTQLVEFGICVYENFVYVTGGQTSASDEAMFVVNGAYRMDPHNAKWTKVAQMKENRCLFTLSSIWRRLYAVGGANQNGIIRDTEYYIPEEDQWCEGPHLKTPLHEHAACVFRNKLYISGGHNGNEHTNEVCVLERKDGPWKLAPPLLQTRCYHAMIVIDDKMYVIGGCTKAGDEIIDLFSVEEFNPSSNSWMHILTLNSSISNCLPVVISNKVLFVGGYSFSQKKYLRQAVVVDLGKRQWCLFPADIRLEKDMVEYMCLKLKINDRVLKS